LYLLQKFPQSNSWISNISTVVLQVIQWTRQFLIHLSSPAIVHFFSWSRVKVHRYIDIR
jgi:hypothetical protein